MRFAYGYDAPLPCAGADGEQVFGTVSALARADVEVDLLTPLPRAEVLTAEQIKQHYGVTGSFGVHQLGPPLRGPRPLQKIAHARRVARHERTHAADVVHTRNLPVVAAALAAGHRVLYDTYRPWPEQVPALRPLLRRLLGHSRLIGVLLHSDYAAQSYRRLGLEAHKVAVAHNGFDPQKMTPRLTREAARRRLDLPSHQAIATYTGRLAFEKGLKPVLEAARRCPEVIFMLVGSRRQGPVERAAERIPNLRVVGWQSSAALPLYLYASDVLLIPPSMAPLKRHGNTVMPLKVFNYLAAGRVIVAPDAPDTSELLRHGENALRVRPGDEDHFVATIREALASPSLARRLSESALECAADLTWDARARRILAFIRSG